MREDRIGQQLSPYGVSKYSNELYARVFAELYGLKIMGLRYFNVFGPGQNPKGPYAAVIPLFISLLKEGKRPLSMETDVRPGTLPLWKTWCKPMSGP